MKIVLIGGHLSPAFSLIQEMEGEEILFIGRKYPLEGDKALSLEFQFAQYHKITFKAIKTGRFQRKFTRHTAPSLFKFPVGFAQSLSILRKFKPNVVIGFGGYVELPVVMAASLLRIPVVIHEQTLEVGVANRIASRFAQKICISWESSRKCFPQNKVVLTGNPVRKEILSSKAENFQHIKKDKPTIYITGGSLGSHKLNLLVEKCITDLLKIAVVIHQTGDSSEFNDYDRLSKLNLNGYSLRKFFKSEEVAGILGESDLVVSRSGINTVTELIYLQKPAFLIPLSFAQRNEQHKNALMFKNMGLGEVGSEKLSADEFFSTIKKMLENLKNYKTRKSISEEELIGNAAKNIKKVVWETAKA